MSAPIGCFHRFLRLTGGSLRLYTDGVNSVAAITPDGIDASKVNFGAAVGGLNLVRNSSFELASTTGGVAAPVTHTDTGAWNATNRTSSSNIAEGTELGIA